MADGRPPGPDGDWTIVGDPAQSSWPFPQEAQAAMDEVLAASRAVGTPLTVNYRNPSEIAEVAAKVLELAAPAPPFADRRPLHRPGAPLQTAVGSAPQPAAVAARPGPS
ncbi:hypothetical protein GCM10020229_15500 [Kitasatospora albolonga]